MSFEFATCPRVQHKVVQNNEVGRVVWELFNPSAAEGNFAVVSTFEILKHRATCDLQLDKKPGALHSQLGLRFKLGEYITTRCYHKHQYVSLCVQVLHGGRTGVPLGLSVQVDNLERDLSVSTNYTPQTFITITSEEERRSKLVVGEFIRCSSSSVDDHGNVTGRTVYNNTHMYRFGITVRLIHSVRLSPENIRISQQYADKECVTSTLLDSFNELIECGDSSFDIKLITKGGVELGAHRFLVAARSPMLRNLINSEVNKANFNGVILLPEVEALVMATLLHWMYTEEVEIEESSGLVMDEMVETAAKFGLQDFIKSLDTKLITICTTDNMFHLLHAAQFNGMVTAMKDVGRFVKEQP